MLAHVKVHDIREFFEKQMYFGHHMAMVYADYLTTIQYLGEVMGFKVTVV